MHGLVVKKIKSVFIRGIEKDVHRESNFKYKVGCEGRFNERNTVGFCVTFGLKAFMHAK